MADASFGGADLHGHSNRSDGVETPARYARLAAEAGLSVSALTDHDALAGIPEFEEEARAWGLVPVPGVELSVGHEGADIHVLGLFVDPGDERLSDRLAAFRVERDRRGERIVGKLRDLGLPLDLAAIRAVVGEGSFGRPHVARAMVAAGHVASLDEAFDRYLVPGTPAYVPKVKWNLGEAISAIRAAGGLAFLAHPVWYRDAEALVETAVEAGLDGIEAIHPDHDPAAEGRFLSLARRCSLLVTAGSDFHGSECAAKSPGRSRLGLPEWERLAGAAVSRRREEGRPAPALSPA